MILLNGAPIIWKSTLQKNVILSSAEAEYYAMSDAIRSFRFLHGLMENMELAVQGPAQMWVDNQAAIFISKEPEISERSKHFDVRLCARVAQQWDHSCFLSPYRGDDGGRLDQGVGQGQAPGVLRPAGVRHNDVRGCVRH